MSTFVPITRASLSAPMSWEQMDNNLLGLAAAIASSQSAAAITGGTIAGVAITSSTFNSGAFNGGTISGATISGAILGGSTIDGTPVGATTPSTGAFTSLSLGTSLSYLYGGTGLSSPGASGNVLTSNGTGWVSSTPSDAYKDVPATTKTASYILALADRGTCIETTAGVTVPPNSSVAFPGGATISIINTSASAITITAGSGVTLNLAGLGTPGNRTLAGYGVMTVRQTATTNTWYCTGVGLS